MRNAAATSPIWKPAPILPPHVSALLMPLRELVGALHRRAHAAIELAVGEHCTALVLRIRSR
jgi:23S rRNA (uracil1939-C5)-methyltransferase